MLKERLKKGECVLGTWCDIPSPLVANIIAKAGMDFLIVDLEHGPMDFKVAQEMVMAAEAGGSKAIIRVPANNESDILKSLDLGCDGIIVPHIKDVADRDKLISFAKFPPVGNRSYNPYVRALSYSPKTSTEDVNKNTLIAIMLEDSEAISNLEQIANQAEVDVVYLAVYDLAASMGFAGDIKNPKVTEVITKAIGQVVKMGKTAGCMVHSPEDIEYYKKLGTKFLVYKVDSSIVYEACKNIVEGF